MPSRYSHSVVLANYSSRGIISFPNEQQSEHRKSTTASQLISAPPEELRAASTSSIHVLKRPIGSSHLESSSTSEDDCLVDHSSQPQPSPRAKPKLYHHEVTTGGSQEEPQENGTLDDAHLASPLDSEPPLLDQARLSSPLHSYRSPQRSTGSSAPLNLRDDAHQGANGFKIPQRTLAYAAQIAEPSKGKAVQTGARPPPVSSSPSQSRARTLRHVEELLSLQQFLESSPRVDESIKQTRRRPSASMSRSRPIASSTSSRMVDPSTTERKADHQKANQQDERVPIEDIDSSEEDEHVPTTPGTSVQSAISSPMLQSKAKPHSEGRMAKPTEHRNLSLTRLDTSVSVPRDQDRPYLKRNTRPASVAETHVSRSHFGHLPGDTDFSPDPLPLQQHSPLRRTKSNSKVRTVSLQPHTVHPNQKGLVNYLPRSTRRSSTDLTRTVGVPGAELDLANLSDEVEGDGEEEYVDDRQSASNIDVHRRYYRTIDEQVPHSKASRQKSPAQSSLNHRATTTSALEPRQSSSTDSKRVEVASGPQNVSNILTDPDHDRRPIVIMNSQRSDASNIGVPSIIRTPDKQSRSNHGGLDGRGTPSPSPSALKSKVSPVRSRHNYKQHEGVQRGQSDRLSRITEISLQDVTPPGSKWTLRAPGQVHDATDMEEGDYGTETNYQWPLHAARNEDGAISTDSESEDEMTLKARDNFSTDFSITAGDRIKHDPRPTTPHNGFHDPHSNIDNRGVGRTISPLSSPLRASLSIARGRFEVHDDVSELSDISNLEDGGDEEDQDAAESTDAEEAACPPDITRYRRSTHYGREKPDGMQSLINALRTGPPSAAYPQMPVGSGSGIEQLEEKIRKAEDEIQRKSKKGSRGTRVFARLLRR